MHRTMLVIAASLLLPTAATAEPIEVTATLAGHAILPAQSFVNPPPDAPVGLFRSGRFSANERLEQDYGRLERTGLALPFPGQPLQGFSGIKTLGDGRICLIFGYRAEPYSIRAKLSDDNGRTWSDDIILRDDGGDHDIGYPRVVQRPDGKVVIVYYFHDRVTGPERYIAATIWDPGPAGGQRAAGGGP